MGRFEAVGRNTKEPLAEFSPEEREIIREKIHTLSSLVYLIGKDYGMNVEVNPQKGWHWDFEHNVVRADPHDLLAKPIEFLRFVMSHEAGHRRISRVKGVVPDEVWRQPGFSFLMNAIEDPRDNNFVADAIPHFRQEMAFAYGKESDEAKFETAMKEKALEKFGKSPRFMQAGFEYIKLWYKISCGEDPELSADLPEDVREVVLKTLDAARASWNTYPSLQEADEGTTLGERTLTGEQAITEYAKASFNTIYTTVWPHFKTLIDQDIKDAQERGEGKDTHPNEGEGSQGVDNPSDSLPQESTDKPTRPMSPEEAEDLVRGFADELAKHFQGEALKTNEAIPGESGDPEMDGGTKPFKDGAQPEEIEPRPEPTPEAGTPEAKPSIVPRVIDEDIAKLVASLENRHINRPTPYQEVLRKYGALIDQLTFELQEIFNKRRHTRWQAGYKSGKKVHIGRAIQEEVAGASPFETGAFMRREQPQEVDYVVEVLNDLSGSMVNGRKIQEAYTSNVVLAEVLHTIGIRFAITGYNARLHEYKSYDGELTDEARDSLSGMLGEVYSYDARYNDDGWALASVYDRILAQEERQKIIIVISDGKPAPSRAHVMYDLSEVVEKIAAGGKVKVIGLGLGLGTEHVSRYYPNSVANISVQDLAKVLAQKVREAIEES